MGHAGAEQIGHQWAMDGGQRRLASLRNRTRCANLPLAAIHIPTADCGSDAARLCLSSSVAASAVLSDDNK